MPRPRKHTPAVHIIYMVRKILATVILVAAFAQASSAQIRFAYDVNFDFRFDNREYDRSGFQNSATLFGARLAPAVGFDATLGRTSHRLMAGVDALSQFGTSDKEIVCNAVFWYQIGMKFRETDFRLSAGLLPRSFSKGDWSPLFFSDRIRFYDNRFEGLLLSWERPRSYFELGLDWIGVANGSRREEFMVFTSGRVRPLEWLKIGWEAYMLHYACSDLVKQVNDNILSEPYVTFDFAPLTGVQALSLKAGWIQTLQRDRANIGHFVAPYAGELVATLQHWGAGVRNSLTVGKNLMPYIHHVDAEGVSYGEGNFYKGDPFYELVDPRREDWKDIGDGNTSEIRSGLYDRLELYYAPKICEGLHLRASLLFHFHSRQYSGTSQTVSLVFNLDELTSALKAKRGTRRD